MDDRKSAVSSFYGGRKSSLDRLNNDFPSPSTPDYIDRRPRQDDAGSYHNPERPPRGNGAGYNRMSFAHAGREEPLKGGDEEEGGGQGVWDIYADFNNAGPKYGDTFVQQHEETEKPTYAPLVHHDEEALTPNGPVEMVTVPALGPEWQKSEMRSMTKAAKREKKAEARAEKWRAWKRDERGICGTWFTRKTLVFFLFGVCCVVGIVLAFTIPRVPGFAFNGNMPLVNATGNFARSIPTVFSRAPANFSFPASASLQLDTQSNYLPLTFSHLRAQLFDLETGRQVASGDLGHKTVPAKAFPPIQLPLNFTYIATNDTDQTWKNWYDACKNKALYPDGNRPALKFRLVLQAVINGLPGSHSVSTQVDSAPCPIQLPQNAA